jgi:uncharacterized membrane protein (DUF485 family)
MQVVAQVENFQELLQQRQNLAVTVAVVQLL